jgi:type IV secretory pathway VirB10-like protein
VLYGKDLANVSAKILSENINIKPVISILAGTRIMISPSEMCFQRHHGENKLL